MPAAGLVVLLAACASTPSESFYTLSAVVEPARATPPSPTTSARPAAPITIVVDQATLPELVDRPQIVVKSGDSRVAILEQQRWAEPLRSQVSRIVALNLTRLLPAARVATYPDVLDGVPDERSFRVSLDVQRFDSRPGDAVTLEALWTLRRASGAEVASGRETVQESVAGGGYDALVAAHDRALATVSRKIAAAVRTD